MTPNARQEALAFLVGHQLLTPDEAEAALAVAADVLRAGLTRLQDAAASGDALACAEPAHALKGNLLNLGLPELARHAHQAFENAAAGDPSGIGAIVTTLRTALAPLLSRPAD